MTPTRRSFLTAPLGAALVPAFLPAAGLGSPTGEVPVTVRYNRRDIDGVDLFWREAGPATGRTLLLLHGFPSSSHMFRNLIPLLAAAGYRVLAPDYPGFGQSAQPGSEAFPRSFAAIATLMAAFTEAVGAERYTIYLQDYGGPVGFRLALLHPERVEGFVIQNAVASVEGWNPDVVAAIAPFWKERNAETEAAPLSLITPEGVRNQYLAGVADTSIVSPDAWTSDLAHLSRPGNAAYQLDLLWAYQDNVASYPAWKEYLAQAQPRILLAWGRNDPFFRLEGAAYFRDVVPGAELHVLETGHFALETHAAEIATLMLGFLARA